jgi:hypothetical protein
VPPRRRGAFDARPTRRSAVSIEALTGEHLSKETTMGLDQYVFATTMKLDAAVDFEQPHDSQELHYWRKHPNLHGWMEALYRRKAGTDDDFNLSPVALDAADLIELELKIALDLLPVTSGFFFGRSDGSERDDDLEFIETARKAIAEGKTVFYIAWW